MVDGRRGALGELKEAIEKILAKKEDEAQSNDGKKDENQS